MSVIAIASAKGSPGASITAAALAMAWSGEIVLADVDPAGGDLMWRARTPAGHPLDPDRGLLSLGAGVRRGAAEVELDEHLQQSSVGRNVLVGVASPDQLAGLGGAWSQLPAVFSRHPADIIVDCGRVVPGSAVMPVLAGADTVLFMARTDLPGVAHLRERLRSLRDVLDLTGHGGPQVGVGVVTSYRDTRTAADLQQLLDADQLGVRVLGIVADDPKGVGILVGERAGAFHRTLLARSAKQLAAQLTDHRPAPSPAHR